MRFQSHASSCGPASVANALAALGLKRSEEECATLCRTTTEGTGPLNILRALQKLPECSPALVKEGRWAVAGLVLADALSRGRPVILCVDNYGHWVAAVGQLGRDRILVADPADNELVLSYDTATLNQRWRGQGRPAYIGVIL